MTIDKELAIAALCSRAFAEGGNALTYAGSDELGVAVVRLAAEVLRLRDELEEERANALAAGRYVRPAMKDKP